MLYYKMVHSLEEFKKNYLLQNSFFVHPVPIDLIPLETSAHRS